MSMQILNNSAVLLNFTLKLADGSVAESTQAHGKPALFHLGDESLSPALEAELVGLKEGEKKTFTLAGSIFLVNIILILFNTLCLLILRNPVFLKQVPLCCLRQ